MARKSNKTAHVLNLIAGHDSQQETAEETTAGAGAPGASPTQAAAPAPAVSSPVQNVSVIDTTAEDPVADLIQQQLTNQFEEQAGEPSSKPETPVQPEPQPQPETPVQPETQPEVSAQPEPQPQPETPVQPEPQPQPETSAQPEPQPQPETPVQPEPQPQPEASAGSETQPEPEPEPEIALEPDFARVNVMEEIVNDKIIYFMRQFDVCTCDRCVADTCALTLSGLLPKYIVTTPAAIDPLLSFYTNRYISDVTVEATKACMVVKDNPRH